MSHPYGYWKDEPCEEQEGSLCERLAIRGAGPEQRLDNVTDELYTTFGYVEDGQPFWIPAATRSLYLGCTVDW